MLKLYSARKVLSGLITESLVSYGLLPGHVATPFIIVGGPRTGSTLLQNLLNSHPQVICLHEILKETSGKASFMQHFMGQRFSLLQLRDSHIESFIDKIVSSKFPHSVKAMGFKSLYVHPNSQDLRERAWTKLGNIDEMRVIWLHRNPIAATISFCIAKATGKWVGTSVPEHIRVNPDYVLKRLSLEEIWSRKARLAVQKCRVLDVHYEQLVRNQGLCLKEVQEFLEVSIASMCSKLEKQIRRPWSEVIVNYTELDKRLLESRWRKDWKDALADEEDLLQNSGVVSGSEGRN